MRGKRPNFWLNAALLILVAFFGGLLALFAFKLSPHPALEYPVWGALGVLTLVHLCAVVFPASTKQTVLAIGISVVAALYLAELALELSGYTVRYVQTDHLKLARIDKAREIGVPFDQRSRLQVILDERKAGRQAFSGMAGQNTSPSGAMILPDGTEMFAFGGMSQVRIVDCNETGTYSSYVADEKGFNNPTGLWTQADLDIVTLGGSFVHGACLPREKTMVGRIREVISPRTLNLSATGPSPLEDFVRLAEFGPRLKPKIVLWFFYEQFIFSAHREALKKSFLRAYLDDPSPRGAYGATRKLDEVLLAQHDRLMAEAIENVGKPEGDHHTFYQFGIRNLVSLRNVRFWLGAVRQTDLESLLTPEEATRLGDSLSRTIATAKSVAHGWGGKLIIVYINGYNRFMAPRDEWKRLFPFQREFFEIVRANDLPLLDLSVAFADHEDPGKLYPFGMEGHFSEEGAHFAARRVKAFLEAGGYLSKPNGS